MSAVIDRVKEKFPEYRDTPDDQLTLKIAEKFPQYLDSDPQFKDDYQQTVAMGVAASVGLAVHGVGQVVGILTNPAAGKAAEAGREGSEGELPTAAPSATLRPASVYERFRFGPVGQALLGKTSTERQLEDKGAMGPIEGLTHQVKALDLKPKDIVEAARQFTAASLGVDPDKLAPQPTNESVAQAMRQSKTAALSIGVVKGLEDMDNFFTSPLGVATLGTGALPKLAQRMVALGFSAQMASQVPEIARQLGDEMGKPEDQRDYQKIGNLATQAVSTTGFSVMGVLHAAHGARVTEEGQPSELSKELSSAKATVKETVSQIRGVAPATAQALGETVKEPEVKQQQVAGAEAGTRSIQGKTQQQLDFDHYTELTRSLRGKGMNEAIPIMQQIEQLKNRYGGMPPKPTEVITHAAFLDEEGNPQLGANHPEILDRLGVEGFGSRESRNTPQFGFWTSRGRFISREEAGQVATGSGQNLQDFDIGEPVHSDQIRSSVDPEQTLGDSPAQSSPVPAGAAPVIQAGAAHVLEIPETGAGGEKYGISQKVREERARAGQVELVQPGQGTNVEDSVQRGRDVYQADPASAERMLQEFEADPQHRTSETLFGVTRAHGEALAKSQRIIEEQFGTESPEWQQAKELLNAWDKRTKPINTAWGRQGKTQQGYTDLDTGSVGGLERERRNLTDQDFTPEEKKEAARIAKDVRDKENAANQAATDLHNEIDKNASPERQLQADQQGLHDATRASNEAADQSEAAQRAIDAANKVVREAAVARADAETKARVEQAKRDVDTAKVQLKAAEKAKAEADKNVRRLAAQVAKVEAKVKARAELDEQRKAAEKAVLAAQQTVREAVVRRAEAENKARESKTEGDRNVADVQSKAAQKAEDAAWKRVREAARQQAALERKILGDSSIPVWEKARQYLRAYDQQGREVPSAISFDDLRNNIAADLGMPVDQVTRLLARTKRMRSLADDLWLKRQRERNTKTKAKLWVQGLDMPGYEKFIRSLPRKLFAIRVGFHGTVALGTHAPAVAFDPRFWGTYVRNFGKMYGLVAKPAFYEAQMQDLVRRKNFATALQAGLVVDPFKFEDFSHPGIEAETTAKIREAIAKATGVDARYFLKMGERGYSILKVLRQDMFDQHWDGLPRHMQTEDMAKGIADAVNHITGVVQTPAPFKAELIAFAPKLQMSRFAFLGADPARAVTTGVRAAVRFGGKTVGYKGKLPQVTPAEQYFAVNELKTKVYALGTLGSLLALNQGILMMSGSNQKVNLTNVFANDFAKFKVAGLNISYGNPLLTMARLPIRVSTMAFGPGGKLRKIIYPDENIYTIVGEYFRSQLSPAASLLADVVTRGDYQQRQLWFSDRPEPKRLAARGVAPYTQGEYLLEQALPIPFQELVRETWKTGFGLSDEQVHAMLKAMGSTGFMMATGGRVSEDYAAGEGKSQ